MTSTILFALLAGVAAATYTIFLRLASVGIHPALGATIVTGVAFLVSGSVTMWLKLTGQPVTFSREHALLLVVVGIAAAGVDFFSILAYSSGLRVTSSFIIGGVSTMLLLLVGFLILREPVSATKLLAIGLIVGGIFLLQREGG